MRAAMTYDRASEAPPPSRGDSGTAVLVLAAFPLLAQAVQGPFPVTANAIFEFVLLVLAVRMISRGHQLHELYTMTPGAKAPRVPRKLIGALLIGALTVLLAGMHFYSLLLPLALGILAVALCLFSFGLDPMRDKPQRDARTQAQESAALALDQADHALAMIADRVAVLEDAILTRRTEAARTVVLSLMRSFAREPETLLRMTRPVDKFIQLLSEEADRLIAAHGGEGTEFARKRYLAKLQVMTESFENGARNSRARTDRDGFALEADLLLDRMPGHNAA
jgi:hypothetical protein